MGRASSLWSASLLAVGLAAAAVQVPAGARLEFRLTSKITTQTAKPKDAVTAVVISPVMVGEEFVLPAGAKLSGTVEKSVTSSKPDERSTLVLAFTELEVDGAKYAIQSRVTGVDNARETVDEQGAINGILAAETLSGRIDEGLSKLAERSSGFAGVLATVKKAVLNAPEADITYEPGTDLELELTAPVSLKAAGGAGPASKLEPLANEDALYDFVNKQPFQTYAETPPKPSDVTNLMLVGSQEAIAASFKDAGWVSADALSTDSKFETFRAIAEQRGYKEAPVSILLLDQRPPDMVFEKLNNTFAERHHLRVWRRPEDFGGKPVWVVAATHDTGIEFSEQNRTFIHKIDSSIDRERAKVVNDLLFTGRVRSVALVERPGVPQNGQNATGDSLITDARMAVLFLN